MESYHETVNGSNVDIWIEADEPRERFLEPVTCGVPWPRGKLREDSCLILRDDGGEQVPLQTRILDRWPDGSVRWLLLDWQASVRGPAHYRLGVSIPKESIAPIPGGIQIERKGRHTTISTGAVQFHLRNGGLFPFESVDIPGTEGAVPFDTICSVQNEFGSDCHPGISSLHVQESGPLRACIRIQGELYGEPYHKMAFATFEGYLHFFAGSPNVRILFTIGNPRRARHPGGIWSLGDKGSIFVKDAWFGIDILMGQIALLEQEKEAAVAEQDLERAAHIFQQIDKLKKGKREGTSQAETASARIRCSAEIGAPLTQCHGPLELYQDSSGGSNWQSSNHVNRHGAVPNSFCGYRLRTGGMLSPPSTSAPRHPGRPGGESMAPSQEQTGRRATPVVTLERDGLTVSVAMRHFWQNFPKAIEAGADSLTLRLFPRHHGDLHEIQAGEQKTHEFVVAFGKDTVTADPLAWVRSPLRVRAEPAWYCSTGAVPYLTPEADDPNTDYVRLVRAAIEGEDTFEKKREVVDEYGWRNFGDIYADHEAVNHQGPKPLVSHYNNQYDPLAGFAYQFMRSGDWRWWSAMEELAAHVIDIDIYHTEQDKAAYNHGLFWHTVHYTDAGLSTHRSYPRAPGVRGGGPGNEHNYTTGLMLHYFLTGHPQSRQAAIDLAQWVIDMDDGTKTVFRWLDRGDTGLASATVSPLYHGPGRGAGNSIQALLDGHRLTGDPQFLAKVEQLIRRCIHPADDIAARNLLDAERRWSYTVFLQALGRYLDYKAELDKIDAMYAYARAALLHYARWMADNEYPYLEKPEILEYPTETWAAQDMRKSEVFKFAAKHTALAERERFLERSEFFFRYVTKTLTGMKARTLTRPVVILLSNGFMHAYFQKHPEVAAPAHRWVYYDVGKPEVFVPQKIRARKRFLALLGAAVFIGILGLLFTLL
jgi:hypothetical protein